jgi:hypothetical protein
MKYKNGKCTFSKKEKKSLYSELKEITEEFKTKYIVRFGVIGVHHNNLADAESALTEFKSRGYDDARIETRIERI